MCAGIAAVVQAAEFQHARWPSHHSRHRSGGGHNSGDLLRSDTKSSTPTGAPCAYSVIPNAQQKQFFPQYYCQLVNSSPYGFLLFYFISFLFCSALSLNFHMPTLFVGLNYRMMFAGGAQRRVDMLKTSSFRSEVSSSSLSLADTAMNHQRGSADSHSPDTSRRNSNAQVASPLGRSLGR